jgi:hypothetical protein
VHRRVPQDSDPFVQNQSSSCERSDELFLMSESAGRQYHTVPAKGDHHTGIPSTWYLLLMVKQFDEPAEGQG